MRADSIAHWKNKAAKEMAACLVSYGATHYAPATGEVTWSGWTSDEPSSEQITLVKESGAYRRVCDLIDVALAQKGDSGPEEIVSLVVRFLTDSGVIYRLRVISQRPNGTSKENEKQRRRRLDRIPALFPRQVSLWWLPHITFNSRGDGENSMECAHYDGLVQCAISFYRTGIRCIWAEKMIVEALVCARQYEVIQTLKRATSGWAYNRTRGEDPQFSTWIRRIRFTSTAATAAIGAYIVWSNVNDYKHDNSMWNLLWLILILLTASAYAARFFVRFAMRWLARLPEENDPVFLRNRSKQFVRAVFALSDLHRTVTATVMSTTAARQATLKSHELGCGIEVDQILVAYFDRALASGEHDWSRCD